MSVYQQFVLLFSSPFLWLLDKKHFLYCLFSTNCLLVLNYISNIVMVTFTLVGAFLEVLSMSPLMMFWSFM